MVTFQRSRMELKRSRITLKQTISTIIVNKFQKCKEKLIGAEKLKLEMILRNMRNESWLNNRINSTLEGIEFETTASKKAKKEKIDSSRSEIEELESTINSLRMKFEGSDKQQLICLRMILLVRKANPKNNANF